MTLHCRGKLQYEKASAYLNRSEKLNLPAKSHRHYIDLFLMQSFLNGKMGNFQEAYDYAEKARKILSATDRLTEDDLNYLHLYANVQSLSAAKQLGFNERDIGVEGDDFDIKNVRARYVKNFGLKKVEGCAC